MYARLPDSTVATLFDNRVNSPTTANPIDQKTFMDACQQSHSTRTEVLSLMPFHRSLCPLASYSPEEGPAEGRRSNETYHLSPSPPQNTSGFPAECRTKKHEKNISWQSVVLLFVSPHYFDTFHIPAHTVDLMCLAQLLSHKSHTSERERERENAIGIPLDIYIFADGRWTL